MLTIKTVLPNFVKTAVFAAATTICLSAAAQHEETQGAAVEGAAEVTHATEDKMTDMKSEATENGSEVIGDLKDIGKELTDEAAEVEKTADMIAK